MAKKTDREERMERSFVQNRHRLLQAIRTGELGSLGRGMMTPEVRAEHSADFEELRKERSK